jgi:hypothetical protein
MGLRRRAAPIGADGTPPRNRRGESGTPDGEGRHWTLTWLEGRPIAELDDGTVVTLEAPSGGNAGDDGDDDW